MLHLPSMPSVLASRVQCSLVYAFLVGAILQGNAPMESLYDHREAASLKPYVNNILSTNFGPVSLFPVPQVNSVGTNDLNNAITLFSFIGRKMTSQTYFKNAFKEVGGGGQFLPVISKDAIGFGQTRRFVLYDFNKNSSQRHGICTSLDDSILHVGIADSQTKKFIFEIEEQNPKSEDYHDVTKSLWLMDLSGESPRLMKKIVKGKGNVWSMFNNQLFLCDFKNIELKVFTSSMEPSHHPLVDVIKKNKGKVDFVMIVPHPTLPFAIFFGGEQGAQYVCWNQTYRDEQPRIIFGLMNTLFYSFSPDGRWVVFQKTEPDPKRSYLMPISEKYPNYLGSPILLEEGTFDRNHFAWTTNPVSLVGAVDGKILRYDLTKEGHPETGNYPSYWDYVVDKDLEKLRQQKKQGLGSKP
jgi:ACT domain-containing protein